MTWGKKGILEVLLLAHKYYCFLDLCEIEMLTHTFLNCGICTVFCVFVLCQMCSFIFDLLEIGRFSLCSPSNLSLIWVKRICHFIPPCGSLLVLELHPRLMAKVWDSCFLKLDCWTCGKFKPFSVWETAKQLTHVVAFRLRSLTWSHPACNFGSLDVSK